MMWGYDGHVSGWLWLPIVLLVGLAAGLITWVLMPTRRQVPEGSGSAAEILRQRFARGEIDEAEYRERAAVLQAGRAEPQPGQARRSAPALVIAVVVVVVLSVLAVGAMAGRRTSAPFGGPRTGPTCTAPSLPGQTVEVTLSDTGGMMGSGYYPGGSMMGSAGRMAMMRVTASPSAVPAGEVSFRVWNAGSIVHELVVLPLPSAGAGTRYVDGEGTVSEDGSLGEVSATCAEGAGDGIAPGAVGWVTLHLAPGRYELLCNLPGHYAMGMFTALDVR